MKKSIMTCIILLLAVFMAFGAIAEETFTTAYFTMQLPDGWLAEAEETVEDDGTGSEPFERGLGYMAAPEDPGLVIGVYLLYYEDLKDLALWNADEAALQEYAESVMEDFEEDNPVYLGTIRAGSIPFVLIRAEDEEGEYLYADTVTNGYAIEFMAYMTDEEEGVMYPITDEDIEQFRQILLTFVPAA